MRVDVPRAGNSYRFARALVLDEETKVTFSYKTSAKINLRPRMIAKNPNEINSCIIRANSRPVLLFHIFRRLAFAPWVVAMGKRNALIDWRMIGIPEHHKFIWIRVGQAQLAQNLESMRRRFL